VRVVSPHENRLLTANRNIPPRSGILALQGGEDVKLTSRGREEHVLEGFDAGVDDYVTKPFRSAELLARIKRYIDG
jgi:CheY-like chemotaxis protein